MNGRHAVPIRVLLLAFADLFELDEPFDRKGPFGHFAVAAVGKIDASHRRYVIDRLAQRAELEPLGILAERVEEPPKPAVLVDVFLSFRPGSELLAVVAETDDGRGDPLGNVAEIIHRLLRLGKRNCVAELLAARENLEQPPLVFGEVIAVQLVVAEAGAFEMVVVEDRVFNSRAGHVGGKVLFPDTLRHPHAADLGTEELFEVPRVGRNLAHPVVRGNSRQDRFVEGAANDFNLAALGQGPDRIDILAVRVGQPFQQATGNVKRNRNLRVIAKDFEKRSVTVAIGVLENPLEIADRLMNVNGQRQT